MTDQPLNTFLKTSPPQEVKRHLVTTPRMPKHIQMRESTRGTNKKMYTIQKNIVST